MGSPNSESVYFRGKIEKILEERKITPAGSETFFTQKVQVRRSDTNETFELEVGTDVQPLNANQRLKPNTQVILTQVSNPDGGLTYAIADVYRLPMLTWLFAGFLVLVLLVARLQGLASIVGMVISLGVLSLYIVPSILSGGNPMIVSILGAGVIAVITIYLSHGFNAHSHIALASMMGSLVVVSLLSALAVQAAQMVGLGSEEAYFLQFGETANINLQGLLLGGIVLGTLGILDDICIAQISTVYQLKQANKDLGFHELYERGLKVGKDHVASLVNTLVLAYAGANLPLFLLFSINQSLPWWVTINNEVIAEEVLRTLVGSMGLVMAVPIATVLGAYVVTHYHLKTQPGTHRHVH
jgi:uncharacterized membrane protein